MEKKLFVVIHHHKFGSSVGLVKASELPSEESVVRALGFDFESDQETLYREWIEVLEASPKEIVEI